MPEHATEHLLDGALGDFAELVQLRTGRSATVYRARERSTDRLVALKVLNLPDPSPRALESFDRESTALARLGSHPNIVTLYRRLTLSDGRPVLVLELCSRAVPDQAGVRAGLPPQQAVAVGVKLAGALATAHRGQVLHCDVRPQNVLVTLFGEPALSDFGVAQLLAHSPRASAPFELLTEHTAPELLEGSPLTEATDVYGLSSTIYALVNGAPAFPAYAAEPPSSVSLRILRDPVPPITAAAVPLELWDVLRWGLAKAPAERPPSAEWLAAELARVEDHQGWPRTKLLVHDPSSQGGTPPQTGPSQAHVA